MRNPDMTQEQYKQAAEALVNAAKGDDESAMQEAFAQFANQIQTTVLQEAEELAGAADSHILAQRGVRQLTSDERNYYQKVSTAMKGSNPLQELKNLDVVMPETVINDVFTDLETNHPLLDAIDFQYAGGVTKWLLNANPEQLATWSPLCAEIVKELTSGFKEIDLQQNKLSAFLPVCKAMLDLGPEWLDRYVRAVLREALALGLEDGIINGRGQGQNIHEPIGMRKDLAGAFDQTNGYPDKTKEVLTSLDPISYGKLLAKLAKTENGHDRVVTEVLFVVNPTDYFTKAMPATTPRATDGTYRYGVFPFPTKVVQSSRMAEGEAILGLGKRYLMASGTGKSGTIDFSDEYQFLEDNRVYLTKFYGHGQAKDNNSFLLLDVSGLKPTVQQVEVVNAADFPAGNA